MTRPPVMEQGCDECEGRGEGAVAWPLEFQPEKVAENRVDVESEGFERGAYFVGMAARQSAGAGAFSFGTIKAVADKRKRSSSRFGFHPQQFVVKAQPLRANKPIGIGGGQSRFRRLYAGGYDAGIVPSGKIFHGIEIERRTCPGASVVAALAAIRNEAFRIAETLHQFFHGNLPYMVAYNAVHRALFFAHEHLHGGA